MNKHQKISVVVWTVDPNGEKRFLLRHSRPFGGYENEWTVLFGNLDEGETLFDCAKREAWEEFGIENGEEIRDLNYSIEYEGKYGPTEIHFFAIKVPNLDTKIVLNEESMGYDWKTKDEAFSVMQHDDEKKALELIL